MSRPIVLIRFVFGWSFLNPKVLLKKYSYLVVFVVEEFLRFKKVILLLFGEAQKLGFSK